MTLVREVLRKRHPDDNWLSALVKLPTGGELYIEDNYSKYDVWVFPKGSVGAVTDLQEDEKHPLVEGTEFEAQLILDYYLGGHHAE